MAVSKVRDMGGVIYHYGTISGTSQPRLEVSERPGVVQWQGSIRTQQRARLCRECTVESTNPGVLPIELSNRCCCCCLIGRNPAGGHRPGDETSSPGRMTQENFCDWIPCRPSHQRQFLARNVWASDVLGKIGFWGNPRSITCPCVRACMGDCWLESVASRLVGCLVARTGRTHDSMVSSTILGIFHPQHPTGARNHWTSKINVPPSLSR